MYPTFTHKLTEANAAVLQEVAQVIKHGFLVLAADSTEVAQKTTAVGHHFRKGDFLQAYFTLSDSLLNIGAFSLRASFFFHINTVD